MSIRGLLWGVTLGSAGSVALYKATYESYVNASNSVQQAIFTINPHAKFGVATAPAAVEDAPPLQDASQAAEDARALRNALSTTWNDAIRCAATTTITTLWLPDGSSRVMNWVAQQSR